MSGARYSLGLLIALLLGLFVASAAAQPSRKGTPPTVSLGEAYVEPDGALVFIKIRNHGLPTGWRIQWGRTLRYGHITEPPEERAYDGAAPVEVEELLEPLAAKTTYHFRAIVFNSSGKAYSRDGTFRTPAWKAGCPQKVSCGINVDP